MVKINEIEELRSLLDGLVFQIGRSELAKSGKWRTINPITGEDVEIEISQEERAKIESDLANALKMVSEKIKSIDWERVE